MGKVLRGIGKAVGAVGKVAGGAIKGTVGRLPIVGGSFTRIGRALSGQGAFLPQLFSGAAPLVLGAGTFGLGPAAGIMSRIGSALGGKLGSSIGTSGFGRTALGTVGKALGGVGKMSPAQLAGLGLGAANVLGQRAQRKSAESFNAAQTDLRNQLMSRILSQPQYSFGQ